MTVKPEVYLLESRNLDITKVWNGSTRSKRSGDAVVAESNLIGRTKTRTN